MVKVFVGCAPNGEDAESQAVLEYTLRKYASEPVDITWMHVSKTGIFSGWMTDAWPTPFSAFRWAVPELCGFQGRAIYFDSDFIVLADIVELWRQPIPKGILAKANGGRLCCSLWDCERVRPYTIPIAELKTNRANHSTAAGKIARGNITTPFAGNWNCLDGEGFARLDDPAIKAIHYTSMRYQPQLEYAIPRLAKHGRRHWFDGKPEPHWRADMQQLFKRLLDEAIEAGFTVDKYFDPAVEPIAIKKANVGNHGRPHWSPYHGK